MDCFKRFKNVFIKITKVTKTTKNLTIKSGNKDDIGKIQIELEVLTKRHSYFIYTVFSKFETMLLSDQTTIAQEKLIYLFKKRSSANLNRK